MTTDTAKAAPITNPLAKYMSKPTRGQAIKAKCAECVGCTLADVEPGFRSTIRDCVSYACPLWVFRPYQRKEPAQ
jgi:hypothetical protein